MHRNHNYVLCSVLWVLLCTLTETTCTELYGNKVLNLENIKSTSKYTHLFYVWKIMKQIMLKCGLCLDISLGLIKQTSCSPQHAAERHKGMHGFNSFSEQLQITSSQPY